MRTVFKLFVAFCVATVLAQGIILSMAVFKGNVHRDSVVKGIALLNGIDISGERLQKIFDDYKRTPTPRYEDVVDERSRDDLDLQMREERIRQMHNDVTAKLEKLKATKAEFDLRLAEFYEMLDAEKANLLDESLQQVKRTLEAIAPDQAKIQLLKLFENGQKEDVIAIFKAMPIDKQKKIVGEFVEDKEVEQLNEILRMILQGEPTSSLLDDARNSRQAQPTPPAP